MLNVVCLFLGWQQVTVFEFSEAPQQGTTNAELFSDSSEKQPYQEGSVALKEGIGCSASALGLQRYWKGHQPLPDALHPCCSCGMVPQFLAVLWESELPFLCLPVLAWCGKRVFVPCQSGISQGAQVPGWLGMLWSWCYSFLRPAIFLVFSLSKSLWDLRKSPGSYPDVNPDFGSDLRGLFKTGKDLSYFVFKGPIFHSVTTQMSVHLLKENLGWQRTSLVYMVRAAQWHS